MRRVAVKLLFVAALLGGAAQSAEALPPACDGNVNTCREIGFAGCCNNACDCHFEGSTAVCECACC